MATLDVLKRASAAGANLVITYEPTFFGRQDGPSPAPPPPASQPTGNRAPGRAYFGLPADDPVYQAKKEFIEKQEFERAVELRYKEEDLRRDVDLEKKTWEDMRDDAEPVVTEEDIAYVVSRMTGIPLSKIEESERRAIEDAVSDLKEALKGEDAEAIKAKTNTLAQASMKLGEAMYKQQAETDAKKDAAKDDVVDAEFTEVDDDKKKSA